MQIDWSDQQRRKAELPRVESFERGSNPKLRRYLHSEKQESEIVLIDEGMQTNSSDEHHRNAECPKTET
jgi:hypothetical protein